MLENMNRTLEKAKVGKYAVAQLNINNLEWTRFILEACEENKAPVILGVSEGAIKYMGGYNVVFSIVSSLIKDLGITIPVVLHLDHGSSLESCMKAVDAGFTSVMIDASKFSIEENITITKAVVDYAHKYNVSVEAEVGAVGGQEDGVIDLLAYAKVEDAVRIAKETAIDVLAPALGSVHGLYKGEPKLDFGRMEQIKGLIDNPLVLHGGTGIPDDLIKRAISCGISKININTELQIVWTKAVREFLKNDDKVYDPRKVIKSGEGSIKESIKEILTLFGSINKA